DRFVRQREAVARLRRRQQRERGKVVAALLVDLELRGRRLGTRLGRLVLLVALFVFFALALFGRVLDLLRLVVGRIGVSRAVRLLEAHRGRVSMQCHHAVAAAEDQGEQERRQQRKPRAQRIEEMIEPAERDEAAPLGRAFVFGLILVFLDLFLCNRLRLGGALLARRRFFRFLLVDRLQAEAGGEQQRDAGRGADDDRDGEAGRARERCAEDPGRRAQQRVPDDAAEPGRQ